MAAVHAADDEGWHCVDVENWGRECVCVCAFARDCGKVLRAKQGTCVRKGTCSLSDTEGKARVFAFVSMGADTKEYSRAAAHCRVVIFVPLRMAASAVAPSAPISLELRLRTRGGAKMVGE